MNAEEYARYEQLRDLLRRVRDTIADEKPTWRDMAAEHALELINESGVDFGDAS